MIVDCLNNTDTITDSDKETGFLAEYGCGMSYFRKKPGFWATASRMQ